MQGAALPGRVGAQNWPLLTEFSGFLPRDGKQGRPPIRVVISTCPAMIAPLLFSPELYSFCHDLPKLELHAHLNGSVNSQTIRRLAESKAVDPALTELASKGDKTLSECFQLFDVIHSITTDLSTITQLTREVCEDFETDGVVYLELRTTPKNRREFGVTKASYIEAVLEGLRQYQQSRNGMEVRLLLSIDRRESAAEAMATVQLAIQHARRGIVGIDLSGNPAVGEWSTWLPALQHARRSGLKITLHAGEVYRPAETAAMLSFQPDRVGHMCCLDDSLKEQLQQSQVPLELCLTSNLITESVTTYDAHHFWPLHQAGHPVVLCTDDAGVFSTTLSREYAIAATAFGLSKQALLTLARSAVDHAFLTTAEKDVLHRQFAEFERACSGAL